jgi:hypothetical protein
MGSGGVKTICQEEGGIVRDRDSTMATRNKKIIINK